MISPIKSWRCNRFHRGELARCDNADNAVVLLQFDRRRRGKLLGQDFLQFAKDGVSNVPQHDPLVDKTLSRNNKPSCLLFQIIAFNSAVPSDLLQVGA